MVNHDLCMPVKVAPSGADVRSWTLRDDNHSHHHGVVNLSESALYLDLSWRETAADPIKWVGMFRLNLPGLLRGDFIRSEPVNSYGPELRLRIVRADDGKFYVQVNQKGPRIELA